MVLVKCKCGSFFTLNSSTQIKTKIVCPNCGKETPISPSTELSECFESENLQFQIIPNNAKIKIKYELN